MSYRLIPNTPESREKLLIRVAHRLIDSKVCRNETIPSQWNTSFRGIKTVDITTPDGTYTLGVNDSDGTVSLILSVDGRKGKEQNVSHLLGE